VEFKNFLKSEQGIKSLQPAGQMDLTQSAPFLN